MTTKRQPPAMQIFTGKLTVNRATSTKGRQFQRYNRWRSAHRELDRSRRLETIALKAAARIDPLAPTVPKARLRKAWARVSIGCDYSATGTKEWEIVRSVHGKTNQVDLRRNGRLFKTGGSVRAKQAVKRGVWKAV